MEGNHVTVVLLVACYCFSIHQSVCGATPPVLTLADIDVELNEQEDKVLDLNGDKPIATCEDGDNDLTRAYIQSVSPSAPCGSKCFMLLPCGAANGTDYCLSFVPTEGTLNYVRASSYTLTVACTDDTDGVSTKTLTVTIKSNTPPSFDPVPPATVTIDGTSVKAGDIVYDVNTKDVDGDPVYYTMLTSPSTSYLSIGYTDGEIRATNDLKYLCESKVTATVRAFDSYNPAIGPKTIEFIVNPYNTAPVIKNLDTTLQVKENTGAGSVIHVLDIVDANVPYKNIRMTSVTSAGLEQYKLNGKNLELNIKPNYERTDTRSVVLYFDVTDGYCSSPQYSLTVNIVDVPEPPVLTPPKRKQIDVYEGDNTIVTGVLLSDEDIGDTHTYTMTSASTWFKMDPQSGDIDTMIPVDIDKKNPSKSFDIDYTVTDNYGEKAKGSLTIVVHDINDNAPLFTSKSYSFTATECTAVASKLGQVAAVDDDSPYQSNDALVYGGGGDKMAVTSTGDVVLVQPCIDGETDSAVASVTDLGEYPGPLQGPSVSITMTCGPCPPTVPPKTTTTTATTTTTTTTKKPSTTVTVVRSSGVDDMEHVMSWLIPALIGGAVFLALTAYMIYRYCIPCRSSCAGKCSQKPKVTKAPPEPQPRAEEPEKLKKPKKATPLAPTAPPPQAAPLQVLPPAPPKPEPNPYLFGFWKEQYTDQDHLTQPARAAKPLPIENMPSEDVVPRGNAPPPDYLKLGNPGPGQFNKPSPVNNNNKNVPAASQAESKKSNCIIL